MFTPNESVYLLKLYVELKRWEFENKNLALYSQLGFFRTFEQPLEDLFPRVRSWLIDSLAEQMRHKSAEFITHIDDINTSNLIFDEMKKIHYKLENVKTYRNSNKSASIYCEGVFDLLKRQPPLILFLESIPLENLNHLCRNMARPYSSLESFYHIAIITLRHITIADDVSYDPELAVVFNQVFNTNFDLKPVKVSTEKSNSSQTLPSSSASQEDIAKDNLTNSQPIITQIEPTPPLSTHVQMTQPPAILFGHYPQLPYINHCPQPHTLTYLNGGQIRYYIF